MDNNKNVIVPIRMEKDFKNALLEHCQNEGMYLSGLIRKLIKEYAEKKGIAK